MEKYLNIKKGKSLEKYTLQDCIKLLPRVLGKYENKDIILLEGKSLYFKCNNKNYPLHYKIKNKTMEEITYNDAIFSINEFIKKKSKKKSSD